MSASSACPGRDLRRPAAGRVSSQTTNAMIPSTSSVARITTHLDRIGRWTNAASKVARRGFGIIDGGPVGTSGGSGSATTWNGNRTCAPRRNGFSVRARSWACPVTPIGQVHDLRGDQEGQLLVRVGRRQLQLDRRVTPVGDLQEVLALPAAGRGDRGDLGLQAEDPADLQVALGDGRGVGVDDRLGPHGERERSRSGWCYRPAARTPPPRWPPAPDRPGPRRASPTPIPRRPRRAPRAGNPRRCCRDCAR